jgi:RNA polymerase sigma-70 factor, ECF subfamily
MAQIATSNSDEALDLVQDAMFKLVQKYSDRQENEWAPLFYRILQSRINDWHRRNSVRNRFRSWLNPKAEDSEDPIQTAPDPQNRSPEEETQINDSMETLQLALNNLPQRQQQAFLLRAWQGLDVKQTAIAMSCAEGSVKTHYSRALHKLREQLSEHWQ